jgi:hypothetical protein
MPYQPERLAPPEQVPGVAWALQNAVASSRKATNDATVTLVSKGSFLERTLEPDFRTPVDLGDICPRYDVMILVVI